MDRKKKTGIEATIDSAFSFKKSARGITDVGRGYFSQAIATIACSHKIDIRDRPDLVPKLREVYLAVQDALDTAISQRSRKRSSAEVNAAFERAWGLLKEPDLNLKVDEIQKRQDDARKKDAKTQARRQPIMKQYEIKKADPPGQDVDLHIFLGADRLTGPQEWIPTESFGNNQTLDTVLWLLIQHGICRMDQNPYFYSRRAFDIETLNRHYETDPLSFDTKLKRSKDVRVLHVLVDQDCRLVLQSEDLTFYRNFGNIWPPGQYKEPCRIVKHLDGTLEATDQIDAQISELRLRLVAGSADPPGFNIWDEYVRYSSSNTGEAVFIYEYEKDSDDCGEILSGEECKPAVPSDFALSFKKSALGVTGIGRDYFSRAIEMIACCHEIDIEGRPDGFPELRQVYLAVQDTLNAATSKGCRNRSPAEVDAAFESAWDLLKEPDLNLHVEDIQKRQDSARQMDRRTQARLVPIMEEGIQAQAPHSEDVNLDIFLGAHHLTGPPDRIITAEPFNSNQTLDTVLWLLIQHGICRMDQNPYFYSSEALDLESLNRHYKTAPLSSKEGLRRSEDTSSLHLLADNDCRLVLRSEDLSFYRTFGNIWSTSGSAECKIVKHPNGTLEATNRIDSQISALRLKLVSGPAGLFQTNSNVWDEYLRYSSSNTGEVVFIYEYEKVNRSPAEVDAAFERAWDLVKEPDLNLHVEEIQERQHSAQQKDAKTQAGLVPITKQVEIQAHSPSEDVNLDTFIGAHHLTGFQKGIIHEPFRNTPTLNTFLWLLIQHGICKMDQNPYFYSREALDFAILGPLYKAAPLSFKEMLRRSEATSSLYVLVDADCRLVLRSEDFSFYRNFGNIWSMPGSAECKVVKHLNGTLEATDRIDAQISALRLRLVSGPTNVWGEYVNYVSNVGEAVFIYKKVSEEEWEAEEREAREREAEEREAE